MSIGRTVLHTTGRGSGILASDKGKIAKVGGLTIDWSTVTPVQGQNEIVTLTVTAISGNITFVLGGQTATVAYDATAPTLETAIEALSTVGNGNVKVDKTGSVFTVEFINDLAKSNVGTVTSSGADVAVSQQGAADADVTLTDGTVVKIGDKYLEAGTVLNLITASGKYGPVNTAASDGRETVDATRRGKAYILTDHAILSEKHVEVGFVIEGGSVYSSRLKIGGTGQPTEANLLTMFPQITLVRDA